MANRVARVVLGLLAASSLAWVGGPRLAGGQGPGGGSESMIRDGFEGPKVAWRQEQTDAPVKIFAHERTRRAAHEGLLSEGFSFEAGIGGGLYYSYPLPKIPVTDDLKVTLYVRANRPGAQILGRVVLPGDVDPDSRRPSFVSISGTTYDTMDRWQKVEIADLPSLIRDQARVLSAVSKRKINLKGAYLERLVVNVNSGEGETEVYLDELAVGPVATEAVAEHARMIRGGESPARGPGGPTARTIADRLRTDREPLEPNAPGANARIKVDRNRITRDGFPWFPTAIRSPGADPDLLRRIGCDVMVIPAGTSEDVIKAARAAGLFLIPELTGGVPEGKLPDADRTVAEAVAFPWKDEVFAWSVGDRLGDSSDPAVRKEALRRVREAVLGIRRAKPGGSPYTTGTVTGMLPEYARIPENLTMIGIPAATWGTAHGPLENYQYLEQRRLLTARSNADAPITAEIDVTPPPVFQRAIWGTDTPFAWGVPRIQPEQVRIAAYSAIAAGCRGLTFRAEGDLSQGPGRMATIEMALVNEEIDLLEPILADPDKAVRLVDTYMADPPPPPPLTLFAMNTGTAMRPKVPKEFPPNFTIKAASISTKDRRGTLLMVADFQPYAQFQPPQSAMNKVKLIVPAPRDAHAYLISPGGVKTLGMPDHLPSEAGGHSINIEDFGVTGLVLLTTNAELKDQIERSINQIRPKAVSLAIEQAELHRAWVVEVDALLQDARHPQKHSADLIAAADALIQSARDAQERFDYQTAWDEARRAGRPLRHLMRYHFMAAYDEFVKALNDEDLPCGPIAYEGKEKPQPRLISPIVAPPLVSFGTLPQAWTWLEWVKTGRLGPNILPSGGFNLADMKEFLAQGWTDASYRVDDVNPQASLAKGGPDNPKPDDEGGSNLVLFAGPRKGLTLDQLPPFVDHPLVAVRSPAVPVKAGEVYRISVMAFLPKPTAPGLGGVIVRDSLGGERLQYRSSGALSGNWYEIVYYRRVPADTTLSVTLGLAGYGLCTFDDLRIEPIVEQLDPDRPRVARPRRRRPLTAPAETSTARTTAPAATPERAPTRAATRPQPYPIRQ